MIADVMAVLSKGGPAGIFYSRKPTLFGNEAELRWLPYINSRSWCVKTEYNLPDDESEAIKQLILLNVPGARVVP